MVANEKGEQGRGRRFKIGQRDQFARGIRQAKVRRDNCPAATWWMVSVPYRKIWGIILPRRTSRSTQKSKAALTVMREQSVNGDLNTYPFGIMLGCREGKNEIGHPCIHTIQGFLQTLAAGARRWAIVLPAVADTPAPEGPEVLNVRDFRAAGDGKADDTEAFRKALAAAAKLHSGRTVAVPGGSYRLTSSLNLKSTLLLGQSAGGWPADSRPLPTLLVDIPCA